MAKKTYKMIMRILEKAALFNPFLLALIPVLSTLQEKQYFFELNVASRYIFFSFIIVASFYLVAGYFIKDWHKSSLILCLAIFTFYLYPFWSSLLTDSVTMILKGDFARYYITLISLLVFVFFFFATLKSKKILSINIAFFLFLISGTVYYCILLKQGDSKKQDVYREESKVYSKELDNWGFDKKAKKPNIYHIILDGHARSDVLNKYYDYDNGEFISDLESEGFFVATKSRSNYVQTILSISSTLNSDYLRNLAPELVNTESVNRSPIIDNRIFKNRVASTLGQLGYKIASFRSCVYGTDYYWSNVSFQQPRTLNQFERLMVNGSVLKGIFNAGEVGGTAYTRKTQADRISWTLNHLPDAENINGPVYVFAHVLSPHPPFVFDSKGTIVSENEIVTANDGNNESGENNYIKKYHDQVEYIDREIKMTIDTIMKKSNGNSVIILQSDHGPASTFSWKTDVNNRDGNNYVERTSILNALYLPPKYINYFRDDTTLVNTYPLVFKSLFNTHYPLLENEISFSEWDTPYKFIDVTDITDPNKLSL